MDKRPEENYGLSGLPTEAEYLRADRQRLIERIAQLEAALRTANADFKACWVATGNPEALASLKRTEVALGLTSERDVK